MARSNIQPTTQAREHQDQARGQRPGRPQTGGRQETQAGGRGGQGPYTRMQGTSETAILRTCLDTVAETFNYCLDEGGDHVKPQHLKCMMDCWDIVHCTSTLIARESEHAQRFKEICAEAVKACEESCEEFEGDERMTACADICRQAYENLTGNPREGSRGNPNPNRGGKPTGEEE